MATRHKRKRKPMPTGIRRRRWTAKEYETLLKHSKARTPTVKVAKLLKRTPLALRLQAHMLGIPLGHMA